MWPVVLGGIDSSEPAAPRFEIIWHREAGGAPAIYALLNGRVQQCPRAALRDRAGRYIASRSRTGTRGRPL